MGRKNLKDLEHLDKENEEYIESIQDLINVVRSTSEDSINKINLDVEVFQYIADRQLKSGTCFIPSYLIYLDYLDWCEHRPQHSFIGFFKKFKKKFAKKRMSYGIVYGMSKTCFPKYNKLTRKEFFDLKKEVMPIINGLGESDATESKEESGQENDSFQQSFKEER
jgi:hypothetical protein